MNISQLKSSRAQKILIQCCRDYSGCDRIPTKYSDPKEVKLKVPEDGWLTSPVMDREAERLKFHRSKIWIP
jgi:hypothetical protein